MRELDGSRVLVLGSGISGRSAAAFCAAQGARVVVADERGGDAAALAADLASGRGGPVEVRLGAPFPDAADFDLVVPSPGVPPSRYAARARRVWGDIELAFRALAVPVVAVTGTNGKSTTTVLAAAMLRAAGLRARAAGNLGEPALGLVGQPLDVAVLEVSSFQLETVETFRPRVAVLLNLEENHLDRHGSFDAYAAAKARIFAAQREDDVAVVNADDLRALALARAGRASLRTFQRVGPVARGAWWEGSAIGLAGPEGVRRLALDDFVDVAFPPAENLLAALLAAEAMGADPAKALRALADFRPLAHRLEALGQLGGATWIDDSKATTPAAARFALERQSAPVVWIAGGRDKDLPFESAGRAARGRVRIALLIGEAAGKIADALGGDVPFERVGDLAAAARRAAELARAGDVVLLSPACASFDQFRSFEERGERFRALFATLRAGGAG
jgi:UDP-N-acetylmuramoylalanine--D-glutamate ligase